MDSLSDTAPGPHVFGDFRLDAGRRALTLRGTPIRLGGRGFDILLLLVEARDRVVGREELMASVWPGIVVEPHNLSVQISSLRRALGDTGNEPSLIATIPGRGYRFIGHLGAAPEPAAIEPAAARRPLRPRAAAFGLAGLALVAALAWFAAPKPVPPPPRLSIVVMPFRNLTDDGSRPYLADAISDDLTTDLAHLPGSLVIARATADTYRGRAVTAAEIGRSLHVRYVLEGSLRAEGAMLRINAQLIETATETHLWSDRFETPLETLASTRTDIVRRIASALDVQMTAAEVSRAPAGRDADALDLVLRARAEMARHNSFAGLVAAQNLLEHALAQDPQDAEAMGELSLLLVRKAEGFDDPDQARDWRQAGELAHRALSSNPRQAKALVALGRMQANEGHPEQARASFATALQQNPNDGDALFGMANAAWAGGDPDVTMQTISGLLRIDPASPRTANRRALLGTAAFMAGKDAVAVENLNLAIAGDTDGAPAGGDLGRVEFSRLFLIAAAWVRGDQAEARSLYQRYAARWTLRSTWRIAGYFTPEQARLPRFPVLLAALKGAGMPEFLDEHADYGVPPSASPTGGGDFAATPLALPGARTVDAPALRVELSAHKCLILDVGRGVSTIPGALVPARIAPDRDPVEVARDSLEKMAPGDRDAPIVVMGDGVAGGQSHDAALRLVEAGYRRVLWFRGGEEAWAKTMRRTEDRL